MELRRYRPSLDKITFSIPASAYAALPIEYRRYFPRNEFSVGYLLSTDTAKAKKAQHQRWMNAVLYLSPSTKIGLPGVNLCGAESAACRLACLDDSGRLGRIFGQKAMAARTLFFLFHQASFIERLLLEIESLQRFCSLHKLRLALRLNGTSDRPFESRKYGHLIQLITESFPGVKLYDYTKHFIRATSRYREHHGITSYHVTFSFSGSNWTQCQRLLQESINVAVPFATAFPRHFRRYRVHDGDAHDLRFLDPSPRVVGLRFKAVLNGQGGTVRPTDIPQFAIAC